RPDVDHTSVRGCGRSQLGMCRRRIVVPRMRYWSFVPALLAAPALVFAQVTADAVSGCQGAAPERTVSANPGNYTGFLATLGPGDRLLLAAGTYSSGLPITSLTGAPGRCITIEGPATGPRAVFTGRDCCNTVSIQNSSYVAIRHLDLDGQGRAG